MILLLACKEAQQAWQTVSRKVDEVQAAAATPEMPCDAEVPSKSPVRCLSGELRCGDVIEGTTVGGDSNWSDAFYVHNFCFPAGDGRSGPERVYLLRAADHQDISIRLDSDCQDLDLAAMAWKYEGSCPVDGSAIPECEASTRPGGGTVRLNTFNARDYLIAVEGKRGQSGPFRLTVTCQELFR